jgi:hypothetical protein
LLLQIPADRTQFLKCQHVQVVSLIGMEALALEIAAAKRILDHQPDSVSFQAARHIIMTVDGCALLTW